MFLQSVWAGPAPQVKTDDDVVFIPKPMYDIFDVLVRAADAAVDGMCESASVAWCGVCVRRRHMEEQG